MHPYYLAIEDKNSGHTYGYAIVWRLPIIDGPFDPVTDYFDDAKEILEALTTRMNQHGDYRIFYGNTNCEDLLSLDGYHIEDWPAALKLWKESLEGLGFTVGEWEQT